MALKFVKLQKILLFIPILNFFIFVIWSFNQFIIFKYISLMRATMIIAATLLSCVTLIAIEMRIFQGLIPDQTSSLYFILYYLEGITLGTGCLLSQTITVRSINGKGDL